jgi:hypothetical protein
MPLSQTSASRLVLRYTGILDCEPWWHTWLYVVHSPGAVLAVVGLALFVRSLHFELRFDLVMYFIRVQNRPVCRRCALRARAHAAIWQGWRKRSAWLVEPRISCRRAREVGEAFRVSLAAFFCCLRHADTITIHDTRPVFLHP